MRRKEIIQFASAGLATFLWGPESALPVAHLAGRVHDRLTGADDPTAYAKAAKRRSR
jgi:hypothetical protein